MVMVFSGRNSIFVPPRKSIPTFNPLNINDSTPGTITINEMARKSYRFPTRLNTAFPFSLYSHIKQCCSDAPGTPWQSSQEEAQIVRGDSQRRSAPVDSGRCASRQRL